MKKIDFDLAVWMIAVAFLLGIILTICITDPARAATKPLVIGHRGVSMTHHAENTLGAFRYAAEQGADMVELDVQWTKDGMPIILHDLTLDRTTNCTGTPAEKTYRQIKRCHIDGTDEYVSSLARAITVARRGNVDLLIHMGPRTLTAKQADSIITMVYRGKWEKRTIVQSFFHGTLTVVRNQDDAKKLRYAVLSSRTLPSVEYIKKYHASTVALPYIRLTPGKVKEYQMAGIKVYVWTTVSMADQRKAMGLRPDGIITDNVPELEQKVESAR